MKTAVKPKGSNELKRVVAGQRLKVAPSTSIAFPRLFTKKGIHPFDEVSWVKRSSVIKEPDGKVVSETKDVEVPEDWSQLATDILASKYLRRAGVPNSGRENSLKEVIFRIANTLRVTGKERGYFASTEDAENFEMELTYMLLHQMGAFNSPVWFNCGLYHQYKIGGSGGNWYWDEEAMTIREGTDAYSHPQCSACFIQSVQDDLMSLFDLAKSEAKLFKYGSGTGTNFSKIRGKQEKLSGGGTSSGLLSFLEVLDKGAGATKSGGTTRRAAKMVCLNMDHPEILDFITWKAREEKKAKALIDAGWESDFNGEAYHTVSGQNANNSIRVSDDFMHSYLSGGKWNTTFRTTGEVSDTYDAKFLMKEISKSTWACADPAVQFDTVINDWHTCSASGRINASNPCSEVMFLDDTACNLSSINLMKFADSNGDLNIESFRHACQIFTAAQEIIVDFSSYPTHNIARNTHIFRPLGLGYTNLGTLLMTNGIPYDSPKGLTIAAAITAIMCGHAYVTSAEIARSKGPFEGFKENRLSMFRVMHKHRDAVYKIDTRLCPSELLKAALEDWDNAIKLGEAYGFRNAQATALAPTGTIGLLMDCDTTGVEPEFSLVKWKKLAGGGYFKIVNQSLPQALTKLGYTTDEIQNICGFILGRATLKGAPHVNPAALKARGLSDEQIDEAEKHIVVMKGLDSWTPHVSPKKLSSMGFSEKEIKEAQVYIGGAQTVEGAPHLKEEDYAVFDCANKGGIGKRFIDPMGHIKMMAAVQPFISGGISKTINIPNHVTADDIERLYMESWKMGLKAVALYRDGSKFSQPLSSKTTMDDDRKEPEKEKGLRRGERATLPQVRKGFTVESSVRGHKLFLRTGEYNDGVLGEIFIDMYKEGAAYRSIINCFAIAVSIGLQYGVPLEKFVNSFTFTRFDPQGTTDHPNIKMCTSLLDFVFRVLGMHYLGRTDFVHLKPATVDDIKHHENGEAGEKESPVPFSVIDKGADAVNSQLAEMMGDAPVCDICGHMTVRNGSCYKCLNCGNSLGCS